MLLKFKVKNFQVFSSEVELNLEADLRTQKFRSNVALHPNGNALKAAAIYGPNNTGKTCLFRAIRHYRSILLNKPFNLTPNLFSNSATVSMGAVFLWQGQKYSYSFKYDETAKSFVEESFSRINVDEYGNERVDSSFKRCEQGAGSTSSCKDLEKIINLASRDNLLIHTLNPRGLALLTEARAVLKGFGESIAVVELPSLEPYKTIDILKKRNSPKAKAIVELIKKADLQIDDFSYDEEARIKVTFQRDQEDEKAKGIQDTESILNLWRLISVQKGIRLPSIIFDSLGTKKIVSFAGYLVDCLDRGDTLVVDEFDSGLHFKLTRAIVSLFNNSLNQRAQLIFSTHDTGLLDIKNLFRKEQIWFTHKDKKQVYLYPLADFTAENSGIRSDSDLFGPYSKGEFGAIPEPSLIELLLEEKDDGVV